MECGRCHDGEIGPFKLFHDVYHQNTLVVYRWCQLKNGRVLLVLKKMYKYDIHTKLAKDLNK